MRLSPPIPVPKPRPSKLERADRRKRRASLDRRESEKVRQRSGGRCEVVVVAVSILGTGATLAIPCQNRATHVHHMIGGQMRGRGVSALSGHKQHVCAECHRDITGDVGGKRLIQQSGPVPLWTDTYRRVR